MYASDYNHFIMDLDEFSSLQKVSFEFSTLTTVLSRHVKLHVTEYQLLLSQFLEVNVMLQLN